MSGFRLGKFFGVNVNIDWSWLLIFTLVSWSLASTFGQVHPEWSTAMQLGLALIAAVLFFLSVLAHELAHSLVANARKHPVRSITMFLFVAHLWATRLACCPNLGRLARSLSGWGPSISCWGFST